METASWTERMLVELVGRCRREQDRAFLAVLPAAAKVWQEWADRTARAVNYLRERQGRAALRAATPGTVYLHLMDRDD